MPPLLSVAHIMLVVAPPHAAGSARTRRTRHHGRVSTPTGTTDEHQSPPEPAARRGVRGTAGDMIRTLLVILAVVAVIFFLVPRPGRIPPAPVDVPGSAQGAAGTLGFTPLVPQGLPADWTATAAEARDGMDGVKAFHIGYVTGRQYYAGVEQATSVTDEWLNVNDAGGTPVGEVTIDGVKWQRLEKPERTYTSLLVRRPGRVVLVTSKGGGVAEATVLARALHVPAS
jgi:hypothetical protein